MCACLMFWIYRLWAKVYVLFFFLTLFPHPHLISEWGYQMTLKFLVNDKGVDKQSSNLPFVLMLTDLEYPKIEYFSQKIMLSASSYSSHSNSPDPLHLLPIYLLKRRLRYLFSKALLSNTVDSGHKRLFKFKLVKGLPWLCTG